MAINKNAQIAIHTAATAAAGVSASPIPFSDSALLIPIQITMISAIYKAYGQSVSEGFISGAVKSTMVSTLGKGIAGNLLKMVPGIGTIAGTMINGSVAVAFTEAIGFGVANELEHGTEDKTLNIAEIIERIIKEFTKKSLVKNSLFKRGK